MFDKVGRLFGVTEDPFYMELAIREAHEWWGIPRKDWPEHVKLAQSLIDRYRIQRFLTHLRNVFNRKRFGLWLKMIAQEILPQFPKGVIGAALALYACDALVSWLKW